MGGTPPGPGYTPVNVPPPMMPPRGPGFIPPPGMPMGAGPGDIRLPPPLIPPFSVPPPGFGFGGPPAPPNHSGIVIYFKFPKRLCVNIRVGLKENLELVYRVMIYII